MCSRFMFFLIFSSFSRSYLWAPWNNFRRRQIYSPSLHKILLLLSVKMNYERFGFGGGEREPRALRL